jgi:hypothetical protein
VVKISIVAGMLRNNKNGGAHFCVPININGAAEATALQNYEFSILDSITE